MSISQVGSNQDLPMYEKPIVPGETRTQRPFVEVKKQETGDSSPPKSSPMAMAASFAPPISKQEIYDKIADANAEVKEEMNNLNEMMGGSGSTTLSKEERDKLIADAAAKRRE